MKTVSCNPLPAEKSSKGDKGLPAFLLYDLLDQLKQGKFEDTLGPSSDEEIYVYHPELSRITYSITYSHPVFIFPDQVQTDKFKLKKPLPVVIEKDENWFSIYNEELNISTLGETKGEAINNFIDFLTKDYLTYKKTPKDKLSEGAKRLLANYEEWIENK